MYMRCIIIIQFEKNDLKRFFSLTIFSIHYNNNNCIAVVIIVAVPRISDRSALDDSNYIRSGHGSLLIASGGKKKIKNSLDKTHWHRYIIATWCKH